MPHTDVHADGSIELTQSWFPGGSQGRPLPEFEDGELYMLAVYTIDERWTVHTVRVYVVGGEVQFVEPIDEKPFRELVWGEVDWWCPCSSLHLLEVP